MLDADAIKSRIRGARESGHAVDIECGRMWQSLGGLAADLPGVTATTLDAARDFFRGDASTRPCVTEVSGKDASIVWEKLLSASKKVAKTPRGKEALQLLRSCVVFGESRCRELLEMMGLPGDGQFHGANFLRNAAGSGPQVCHWDTLRIFQFIVSLTDGEATLVADGEPMPTLREAVEYMEQAQPGWDFQNLRRTWGDAAAEAYLPQCVRLLRKTASEAALRPRGIAPKGTVHCVCPRGEHAGPGAGADDRWVLFIAYALPDDSVRLAAAHHRF